MEHMDHLDMAQIVAQHDEIGLAKLIIGLNGQPWNAETLALGRAIAAYEDQRGWYDRAQQRYHRLLERAEAEQPDSPAVAELYLDLAEMAERWNEPLLRPLEKAQPMVKKSGDWALQARQYRLNGLFACLTGSFEGAQIALNKALALYQQHEDALGEDQALNGLAFLAAYRRRYDEALELLSRVLRRNNEPEARMGDPRASRLLADVLMNMGYVLRRLDKQKGSSQALPYYQQAVQVHDLRRDPLGYAQASASLEAALEGLGRREEAQAALLAGFARLSEAHLLDRGGTLFNNYAVLCTRMGPSTPGLDQVRPYVEGWLADFMRLSADPAASPARVEQYAKSFAEVAKVLDPPAAQDLLGRMLAFFEQAAPGSAAAAAPKIYAPLLEKGLDPLPLVDPLARGLEGHFPLLLNFLQVCRDLKTEWLIHNPGEDEDLSAFVPAAEPHMPAIREAGPAVRALARSLSEAAGRSLAARQLLRQRADFLTHLEHAAVLFSELDTLNEILKVLDEADLIVMRPGMRRGYRVRFSGVADTFQLHTLLAAALIGSPAEGWLPGDPPDPRVAAVARSGPVTSSTPAAQGSFNLLSWRALLPGGQLSDDVDTWVWNEGTPAEIPLFEGTRILLVAPPPYLRTWNPSRRYPMLHASLEVVEKLSPKQVDGWIERILKGQERKD